MNTGQQAGLAPLAHAGAHAGTHAAPPGLVVFDFDGTLADSYPWFVAALPDLIRRWRLRPLALGEDATLRQLDATAIFQRLGVRGWQRPLIAADLRRRMGREIDAIALFPGVAAMLRTLADAAGAPPLALVTSNAHANVARVLGPALLGRFAAIECGLALGGKAARLRRLVRRFGVPPGRAWYVGDELRDLAAARAAGLGAAAVSWGYNDPRALDAAAPDRLIASVDEIPAALGLAPAGSATAVAE